MKVTQTARGRLVRAAVVLTSGALTVGLLALGAPAAQADDGVASDTVSYTIPGTVTFKGNAVPNVKVCNGGQDDPSQCATTDVNGAYALNLTVSADDAAVGLPLTAYSSNPAVMADTQYHNQPLSDPAPQYYEPGSDPAVADFQMVAAAAPATIHPAMTVKAFTRTHRPTITGTKRVGKVLTAHHGTWKPAGTITFTYQWFRGKAAIADATTRKYTLTAADKGKRIKVTVTAHKDGYADTTRASKLTKKIRRAK